MSDSPKSNDQPPGAPPSSAAGLAARTNGANATDARPASAVSTGAQGSDAYLADTRISGAQGSSGHDSGADVSTTRPFGSRHPSEDDPESQHDSAPPEASLRGREIIVAVCGGIAAYKVADVVSKLVQLGAGVSVAMTPEAQKFIAALTFEALSGRPVRCSPFDLVESSDAQHITLTQRADLMIVAPATSNIIAKVACGLTDDLVSLMVCAAACPVVFAPAMNNRMWENPITQENVARLAALGYRFIGPEPGWLACRNVGAGRLSEPAKIVDAIVAMLSEPARTPSPAGTPEDGADDDQ
jgi:phosphopantothenoylcysteine decarboxylase/phosphopantothenate--cysteine ligase